MTEGNSVRVLVLNLEGGQITNPMQLAEVPRVGEVVRSGSYVYRVRGVMHEARGENRSPQAHDAVLYCEFRYDQQPSFAALFDEPWPQGGDV
ncbi:MAG: hypothetical protein VYE22_41085 [Myxococcota bacterium]|nr:hypothetical protein [Myxococcota bacterium]